MFGMCDLTVVVVTELRKLLLERGEDRVEGIKRCLLGRMSFTKLYSLFGSHDCDLRLMVVVVEVV
jgi:hypothetical protein